MYLQLVGRKGVSNREFKSFQEKQSPSVAFSQPLIIFFSFGHTWTVFSISFFVIFDINRGVLIGSSLWLLPPMKSQSSATIYLTLSIRNDNAINKLAVAYYQSCSKFVQTSLHLLQSGQLQLNLPKATTQIAKTQQSLTRIKPQGASSEKRSRHIKCVQDNLLHAISKFRHT